MPIEFPTPRGYALVKDVAEFSGVELPPGTLYEALARLERSGLIEAIALVPLK